MVLINSFYLLKGPLFGVGFFVIEPKNSVWEVRWLQLCSVALFLAHSSPGCRTLTFLGNQLVDLFKHALLIGKSITAGSSQVCPDGFEAKFQLGAVSQKAIVWRPAGLLGGYGHAKESGRTDHATSGGQAVQYAPDPLVIKQKDRYRMVAVFFNFVSGWDKVSGEWFNFVPAWDEDMAIDRKWRRLPRL